jgi:hypothetical protein
MNQRCGQRNVCTPSAVKECCEKKSVNDEQERRGNAEDFMEELISCLDPHLRAILELSPNVERLRSGPSWA